MLNILQAALDGIGMSHLRIDGDVASGSARQALVEQFQSDSDIPVMLLTSGVGGLGLTLTAADRVVILDPSWNPASDNQVRRGLSFSIPLGTLPVTIRKEEGGRLVLLLLS